MAVSWARSKAVYDNVATPLLRDHSEGLERTRLLLVSRSVVAGLEKKKDTARGVADDFQIDAGLRHPVPPRPEGWCPPLASPRQGRARARGQHVGPEPHSSKRSENLTECLADSRPALLPEFHSPVFPIYFPRHGGAK